MKVSKIGILGGGQLARMMILEAKKLSFSFFVLDPTPNCPASLVGAKQIIGSFKDPDKICNLAKQVDIITFDIEHINTEQLKILEASGYQIRPSADILATIQDKFIQKQILKKANIPVPNFVLPEPGKPLEQYFDFPFVQKLRYGGYDGQGVKLIKNKQQLYSGFKQDFYLETLVDIKTELSVLIAKNKKEQKVYPVVEMLFDPRTNICDQTLCPARVNKTTSQRAQQIALDAVNSLCPNARGIFAVEMFLTKDEQLMVNEIAPRPHNSGHFTLDGCITSQFEQHIRAVADLGLGSTDLLIPTLMLNILGEGTGKPIIQGLEQCLKIEGVNVHLYEKKTVRPNRKMGHVNIVDQDQKQLFKKAQAVRKFLKIKGVKN